jgi:TPP-dependent pyruvate/acetoin dehydrogenase alpha subunit
VGHSQHNPDNGLKYWTVEELERWRQRERRDVSRRVREYGVNGEAIQVQELSNHTDVEDAIQFALDSPYPEPEEAYRDVY